MIDFDQWMVLEIRFDEVDFSKVLMWIYEIYFPPSFEVVFLVVDVVAKENKSVQISR
jgi:hypothetical protein